MSENVQLVRRVYARWESGDWFGSADGFAEDLELVVRDGVAPTTARGLPAVVAAWADVIREFEDFRLELEDVRAIDDARVLVLLHNSGTARTSGLELGEQPGQLPTRGANVVTVREGRIVRMEAYFNRDNALADLGLDV